MGGWFASKEKGAALVPRPGVRLIKGRSEVVLFGAVRSRAVTGSLTLAHALTGAVAFTHALAGPTLAFAHALAAGSLATHRAFGLRALFVDGGSALAFGTGSVLSVNVGQRQRENRTHYDEECLFHTV